MSRILLLIIIVFCPVYTSAQEDRPAQPPCFSLYGYIKDLQMLVENPFEEKFLYANQLHNRIAFTYYAGEMFTGKIELRNRVFSGTLITDVPGLDEAIGYDNGIIDLSYTSTIGNHSIANFQADRAWIGFRKSKWDLTLGRQRINWGLNTVWNPNDLFNAYNYFDFDYEERSGVDALRVQYYTGGFSFIEAAVSKGENANDIVGALIYRFNTLGYDFQILAGVSNGRFSSGAGWAGNLGSAGFKGEFTWFDRYENEKSKIIFSPGIDITINDGWYLSLSYLHNSNAVSADEIAVLNAVTPASDPFPYTHAGLFNISKQINPLFSANAAVLYSDDKNIALLPALSWSVLPNWDLLLYGQFFKSAGGSNTALFLRVKWSFAGGR